MLFSRTTALVAMSLIAAGTSGVSATLSRHNKTVNPTLARKVKSFNFCARPVIDSVSFQPIVAFDGDSNSSIDAGIPIYFFPYVGRPSLGNGAFPIWGALGNIVSRGMHKV